MIQKLALVVAGLTGLVGFVLLVERGGLIAWTAFLVGFVLLIKVWRRPARFDLGLSVALVVVCTVAWIVTHAYVISTWESGEVVELMIDTQEETHTVRLWVLEMGLAPVVYYEADPAAAKSLLAGKPVQFTRNGKVSTRIPKAIPVNSMSQDDVSRVFEAMNNKYGERNNAAIIYFVLLGHARDHVALVVSLAEE